MTILLTGGTGKTALRIGLRLQKAQIPFMFASRKGQPACPPSGVKDASFVEFDYASPATYANPFEQASTKCDKISAIYLVAPQIPDPVPPMNAFIDYAVEKHNVARFVLLAAQGIEKNGMAQGKVWQHLEDIGVEYAALGPTWFMDNFADPQQDSALAIKNERKIYSASGNGKMPWVSADDIAVIAVDQLTSLGKLQPGKVLILGPELLCIDEVAERFSKVLGSKVEHVKMTSDEREAHLLKAGFPPGKAKLMPFLETRASQGAALGGFPNDNVRQVKGSEPTWIDDWIEENKATWL